MYNFYIHSGNVLEQTPDLPAPVRDPREYSHSDWDQHVHGPTHGAYVRSDLSCHGFPVFVRVVYNESAHPPAPVQPPQTRPGPNSMPLVPSPPLYAKTWTTYYGDRSYGDGPWTAYYLWKLRSPDAPVDEGRWVIGSGL